MIPAYKLDEINSANAFVTNITSSFRDLGLRGTKNCRIPKMIPHVNENVTWAISSNTSLQLDMM